MKKIFTLTIFLLTFIFSANCLAAQTPPEEYVLNEIMPYGDGTAGVNTRLKMNGNCNIYNLPRGSKVIGNLKAGDSIQVTDSRIYTKPSLHPVRVCKQRKLQLRLKVNLERHFTKEIIFICLCRFIKTADVLLGTTAVFYG